MPDLVIDRQTTSLVMIDLQRGIVAQPVGLHTAPEVIGNAARLAGAFRGNGMPVFLTRVAGAPEIMLKVVSDQSFARPGPLPPEWPEFVPGIGPEPSDVVITKHQWGAFYGTDLELQLRRRGMETIVLCGISTSFGVESTARFAYELGFQQIFAEDAMASASEEHHSVTVRAVFPRMGRVRSTEEILAALR